MFSDLPVCSSTQLYIQGEHDDEDLFAHVKELIKQLDAEGIKPSINLNEDDDGDDGEGEWDDEDSDVEMG